MEGEKTASLPDVWHWLLALEPGLQNLFPQHSAASHVGLSRESLSLVLQAVFSMIPAFLVPMGGLLPF